jgi:hypothetical protein
MKVFLVFVALAIVLYAKSTEAIEELEEGNFIFPFYRQRDLSTR